MLCGTGWILSLILLQEKGIANVFCVQVNLVGVVAWHIKIPILKHFSGYFEATYGLKRILDTGKYSDHPRVSSAGYMTDCA